MAADKKHDAWLRFQRAALSVPLGRSKEELEVFLAVARRQNPSLVPVVHGYLELAYRSDTALSPSSSKTRNKVGVSRSRQMHLFDLLREKAFFPQNADLARFAERVLPHMRTFRFDKMSRSDIAARIIEHIENSDPRARPALEASMRDALNAMRKKSTGDSERRSFLSKWEAIIKGSAA